MAVTINKVSSSAKLKAVSELADEIWHECFVDIITVGQIDYMVEKFQSYAAMTAQVADTAITRFAKMMNYADILL